MNTESSDQPGWYEMTFQGRLDERWEGWFDDMSLKTGPPGITVLCGYVVDQAALHRQLTRLRDLGLPIVSVRRVPEDER